MELPGGMMEEARQVPSLPVSAQPGPHFGHSNISLVSQYQGHSVTSALCGSSRGTQ